MNVSDSARRRGYAVLTDFGNVVRADAPDLAHALTETEWQVKPIAPPRMAQIGQKYQAPVVTATTVQTTIVMVAARK